MEKKQEKSFEIDNAEPKDTCEQRHQVLDRMEEALEKNENKTAFRMLRKDIIKILCSEGVLKVCSPYYYRNGRI